MIHRPDRDHAKGPWPVVLALHGGGGRGIQMARMTGLSDLADEAGFLAVYPNGTGRFRRWLLTWNAGNCCGHAHREGVDDVAFIAALIDRLVAEHGADPRRVYVTGLSNGGMMAYRLACHLAERIAAIVPVAGAFNEPDCQPASPVPVMIVHGTDDQHVLYEGGAPQRRADPQPRVDTSVRTARDFWLRHNGCGADSTQDVQGDVVRERFTACPQGGEVVVVTINRGGHAWPGGNPGRPRADRPTKAFSASADGWAFLGAQVRH